MATKHHSNGFDGVKPNSSQIAFAGYDSKKKVLRVEFHNGGAYHYHDVPPSMWQGLQDADSMGSHLHSHVKGCFRCEKKG